METFTLQDGEQVLLRLRKHWIILVRDLGATVLLGILPFFLFGILGATVSTPFSFSGLLPFGALLTAVWLLVIWLALAVLWTNYYLDIWIVTDRRIVSIDQLGLFNRRVLSLVLEDIEEITVHTQNILQAMLHYGTLEIETAGPDEGPLMEGIPYPEHLRNIVLEQVHIIRNQWREDISASGTNNPNSADTEQILRTASHEIKNYLTKDAAALAAIAEGDYEKNPAMLKSMAANALAQTRRGAEAVSQMLQAGGKVVVNAAPFDFAASVRHIAQEYKVAADKKNLTFTVLAEHPAVINGDEEKLGRILVRNLLDNALHYTPGGTVRVTVEKDGSTVRLIVADTGVGLSEGDLQRLFTPGGTGEDSHALNPASTGYGLSIARALVEAHGGHIRAQSHGKGKGSKFIVELPSAE